MRYYSIATVIFTLSLVAYAQTSGPAVVVSVGQQSIKLPTPFGYVNAWENYSKLRTAFEINETEGNQMLAVYAPLGAVPVLDSGKYLGFPRYSRVSVSKRLADSDFSEAQFGQFVDSFEKAVKAMYKSDGLGTQKVVEEIKRDLKKYQGTDGAFELKEPKYLGQTSRTKKAFTCAAIMTVGAFGKNVPVYNTTALVLVRRRILFVYFYAKIEAEGDLNAFNAETQKMVDAILAANPVKELRLNRSL